MLQSEPNQVLKSIEDFHQFSKGFLLCQEIENLPIQPAVFFDASDFVEMIAGLKTLDNFGSFQWGYYHSETCLAHGYAYRGWLGKIHIFPPHLHELLEIIKNRPFLFPHHLPVEEEQLLQNEFWERRQLASLLLNPKPEQAAKDKWFADNVKASAEDLFKGYFLSHETKWKARFKLLRGKKDIVQLPAEEDFIATEVEDSLLFKKILEWLEHRRSHRSFNNYIDAQVLCMLNEKLKKHKNDPERYPLPLFHASQHDILAVAAHFATDEKLGFPFVFRGSVSQREFNVVQRTRFFIDYGIVSNLKKQELGKSRYKFQEYLEKYGEVSVPRTNSPSSASLSFSPDKVLPDDKWKNSTLDSYELTFLELWWEKEGKEEYLYLNQQRSLKPSRSQRLATEIELATFWNKDLKKLEDILLPYDQRIELARDCMFKLEEIRDKIRQVLRDKKMFRQMSIYDELGIRLNFPKEVCEAAQQVLNDLHHFLATKQPRKFDFKLTELVVEMVDSALDQSFSKENQRKFGKVLVICWVLKEYDLIDRVCNKNRQLYEGKNQKDKYPSYPIAMIHADALLSTKANDKLKKCLTILNCVEEKYPIINEGSVGIVAPVGAGKEICQPEKDGSYKAFIGLSFLYYRMWNEYRSLVLTIPELLSAEDRVKVLGSQPYQYLKAAMKYAKAAMNWLSQPHNVKSEAHREKLYYAYNNYLYFSVFCNSEEEFLLSQKQADLLQAAKDSAHWQGRFADTLAWFFLRRAILAETRKDKQFYFDAAKRFNKRALDKAPSVTSKERYEDLKQEIEKHYRSFLLSAGKPYPFN